MGDSLLMQLECLLCALGAKLRFVQHVRKILRAVDKMHKLCTEKMCAERSARSESAHYQCSLASHARALTGASYVIAAGCRAGRYWRHHALGKSLRAAEPHAAFMALVVCHPCFALLANRSRCGIPRLGASGGGIDALRAARMSASLRF